MTCVDGNPPAPAQDLPCTRLLTSCPPLSATGWETGDWTRRGDLCGLAPTSSCARLLTTCHVLPSPAPPRPAQAPDHPPSVSGRWEPPPAPAGHLNRLDAARCSCLFINWILKTFLTKSSNNVCPDALRPLYGLFPRQWRDRVEDSGRLSHEDPGALLVAPTGPQGCCSWGTCRPVAVGHQSPQARSAAQAFITAMKEACRRRARGLGGAAPAGGRPASSPTRVPPPP